MNHSHFLSPSQNSAPGPAVATGALQPPCKGFCLIQKAPAKSIPSPDKLFSILASTFHPSGMQKSSQLSPRFPAEPRGRGAVGSRDLSPSAGPQHALSLSTALTRIPAGCKAGIWGKKRGMQGWAGAGTACATHEPAQLPRRKSRAGKAGASPRPWGSHPNCLLPNLSLCFPKRFQSWEF